MCLAFHSSTPWISCIPTPRSVMGIGQVTEGAMAQVRLFLSINQQNVHWAMLLPLWQLEEELHHSASTGGLILLVEHPLSTGVGDFTDSLMLLWDDFWRNVAQSDKCVVIHTTPLQNTCIGNYVLLRFMDFDVPRCVNFLCYLCHHEWM
jgi:hypothetical protein